MLPRKKCANQCNVFGALVVCRYKKGYCNKPILQSRDLLQLAVGKSSAGRKQVGLPPGLVGCKPMCVSLGPGVYTEYAAVLALPRRVFCCGDKRQLFGDWTCLRCTRAYTRRALHYFLLCVPFPGIDIRQCDLLTRGRPVFLFSSTGPFSSSL